MIRKFCDLCDSQIDDDGPSISVSLQVTKQDYGYSDNHNVRMEDGTWESSNQNHGLICAACHKFILTAIHTIKKVTAK